MSSYAVVWQEEGREPVYAGHADFDAHGLAPHGRAGDAEDRRYICDGALSEVRRGRVARVGGCEAVQLRTRDGLSLLLAAPFGIGVLTEVFELLAVRAASFA
jgi:hypothetical protein